MDYYDYDSFCRPTRDLKHSLLVDWPQHSFYQHNSLISLDHPAPRNFKQEDLGGFLGYPLYQQPRSYDALNLPHQQVLHSPYSAILQSLHHDSLNLPQQQLLHSPYSAVLQSGGDSNFVSVVPPQDSMEVPLSHALEGWDDDRPSSLSSLVESEMNEMNSMISVGNAVEDSTIGDEDAEGEEEWEEEVPQQPCRGGSKRLRSHPASNSSISSSPIPIPVPNLTKKSRGRRVPTMSSLEDLRSASSGAGKKRQGIGGKTARMYLCEVKGCGKCFARGEHLKRHVRSIHTYEKREVYFFLYAHIFTLRIYS
jgi:hypothetical protein